MLELEFSPLKRLFERNLALIFSDNLLVLCNY